MTPVSCTKLAEQFSLPGLQFESSSGGLVRAVIRTSAVSGEICLQGAHVTSWQPVGHEPVLWMSRASNFEKGKPIRGGVPICFPWFGPHPNDSIAPAHGLARTSEWTLGDAWKTADGGIGLFLQTRIDPFLIGFRAEFGQVFKITLSTQLPEDAAGPQRFEDALHTYFSVGDIRLISISGLEGADFIDKAGSATRKSATGMPIGFSGETDRVYVSTESTCVLHDSVRKRSIHVSKSGSGSTVVWNPWIEKSRRMADFGDEEWPQMVCIETANVADNAIELLPGKSHSTAAVISVTRHEHHSIVS